MKIFRDLATAQLNGPTVLTIGTFDGVHRGHQVLLELVRRAATARQAQAAVIAFHPRPVTIFVPDKFSHDYLTTAEERLQLFESQGMDAAVILPFSRELAEVTAHDFVTMLVDNLGMIELWAGHDFALGKNREGDFETLSAMGQAFGYVVRHFNAHQIEGQTASSTKIRNLVATGNVRQATAFLGRYPFYTGVVVHGARRGRQIGFPTANIEVPPEKQVPANGVYATFVRRPGSAERLLSATNVGIRPQFDAGERTIEAHILDFEGDLYGQTLILEFVELLRPEAKFESVAGLVAQMQRDVAQARQILTAELDRLNEMVRLR